MVKNNECIIPKKIEKPVETVYELKDEYKIPTYEEFMKTYEADEKMNYADLENGSKVGEVKGCGPCPDGCSSGNYTKRNQHLISSLNKVAGKGCDWLDEEVSAYNDSGFRMHNAKFSSGGSAGIGGAIASGSADYSAFRYSDDGGDLKIGNVSAGGEIGMGAGGFTAKAELGVDLANVKAKGVQARVGVNFDTGTSIGDGGIGAKAAGFGFSVGKKTGFSAPLGEASVDFEEACVVQ